MKKSSSFAFISTSIFAGVISIVSMTLPAAAQDTPDTDTQRTGTTSNYQEPQRDNSGLWGLIGLTGLLGLLGQRKNDRKITDDKSVSRDYSTH